MGCYEEALNSPTPAHVAQWRYLTAISFDVAPMRAEKSVRTDIFIA